MTFQPPPAEPPASPPPPPPPPAYGGGSGGFDPKTVNPLDWGIMGAGFLAFIFSFFDWYSFSEGPISLSENGWNGFFGWFAALLSLIGGALVALIYFAPQVKLPVPNRLAGLGAFAIATLCMILAIFVTPDYNGVSVPDSVDTGRDFGFWLSLIVVVAGLVLSLMRFQASGGQLPGGLNSKMPNIGGYGPQDRPTPGGGTTPPPPPGYGPPQ